MNRTFLAMNVFIATFFVVSASHAAPFLFSINLIACEIRIVDSVDGSTKGVRLIQFPGLDFDCPTFGHGMARDPETGDLWFTARLFGDPSHRLLRLNPETGALLFVGNTGSPIESVTFNSDGSILYGVSGENTYISETLFKLDKSTGWRRQICTLGNGDAGEAIEFHPGDGMIYHASGKVTKVFEKVNPTTCEITNIGFTPENFGVHATALTYIGSDNFFMADFSTLFDLTSDGNLTNGYRFMDHASKGLAFAEGSLIHTDVSLGGTCKRSGKSTLVEKITIRNNSPNRASEVLLGTRLPSNMFYVSDSLGSCSMSGRFVTCSIGDLPGMSSTTIEIRYHLRFSRKTNVKHDLRVSSREYEMLLEIQDNFLAIDEDCS